MSSSNLFKNIISKDINQSRTAIISLIESNDLEGFKEIVSKADYIFPFVKEKIINNFVKLINKNNLETVFEFSKIYSPDFEDMIVKSWIKFANEDLTDRILELFDKGTVEQKTYCAKYFCAVKDNLSIELLNKYAFSDFEPLKINCASALGGFQEKEIFNIVFDKIQNSDNEFEKLECFKFMCAYNTKNSLEIVVENFSKSPFKTNIVAYLLDFCDVYTLEKYFNVSIISKVFNALLEGYPEDIGLDTIEYYGIYDFIDLLKHNLNPYNNNLLAIAKINFSEYLNNESYNFELDKNAKEELKQIVELLKDFRADFSNIKNNLNSDDEDYLKSALTVIKEYNLSQTSEKLAQLMKEDLALDIKALIAQTLKAINKQDLIPKETINNISDENVKALIESLMV